MKAVVVGNGTIGRALSVELCRLNHSTHTVGRQDQNQFSEHLSTADIAFLCVPSNGDGGSAYYYLSQALTHKKPIVTCEKAALAWHYKRLLPHINHLGLNASVGGGSYILDSLKTDVPIISIVGVLNATLNFLCTSPGKLEERINSAIQKHLCEKPDSSPIFTINREICDVLLKLCILFNHARLGTCTPAMLTLVCYDAKSIIRAMETNNYRFVVCISKKPGNIEHLCISGQINDWHLEAGFTPKATYPQINTMLAENCLATYYSNESMIMTRGLGAGTSPTVGAMLRDAHKLLSHVTV